MKKKAETLNYHAVFGRHSRVSSHNLTKLQKITLDKICENIMDLMDELGIERTVCEISAYSREWESDETTED